MPYKDKKKQQECQKRVERHYSFTVSKISDLDIIEHLENHKPYNSYLKTLVRQDINSK